MANEADMKI
jgi:hypothetical protein